MSTAVATLDNNFRIIDDNNLEEVQGGIVPLILVAYAGIAIGGAVLAVGAGVVAGMKAYAATH